MWSVAEHLLALVQNRLAELVYVTVAVNSDEKAAKKLTRPEPIIRPGETPPVKTERRHGPRPRVGPPIDPTRLGGAPIETTAEEVTWQ